MVFVHYLQCLVEDLAHGGYVVAAKLVCSVLSGDVNTSCLVWCLEMDFCERSVLILLDEECNSERCG
jgi:hypothetical protein